MTLSSPGRPALPYPISYWVIPGRLLAAEYPLSLPGSGQFEYPRRLSDEQRLRNLLDLDISFFMDLTEENEQPVYWPLLLDLAAERGAALTHQRYPIVDHSIASADLIDHAHQEMQASLDAGKNVLVHCKAGIGRTATIIGTYLIRQGMTGPEALDRIAELRTSVPDPRPAPLKENQRQFIRQWSANGHWAEGS